MCALKNFHNTYMMLPSIWMQTQSSVSSVSPYKVELEEHCLKDNVHKAPYHHSVTLCCLWSDSWSGVRFVTFMLLFSMIVTLWGRVGLLMHPVPRSSCTCLVFMFPNQFYCQKWWLLSSQQGPVVYLQRTLMVAFEHGTNGTQMPRSEISNRLQSATCKLQVIKQKKTWMFLYHLLCTDHLSILPVRLKWAGFT